MKYFLDLAQHAAAAPERAGRSGTAAARAHQAHLQHGVLDDGADVEAIALPHPRIGDAPAPLLVLLDARETLVGFQRVAAGGDEIDDVVEIGSRQVRNRARPSAPPRKARRRETARRRRGRARAAPARRARRCAAAGCPAHFPRPRRSRRDIPAPRNGWPAPARRARLRRCGDWRGRCAASAARRPSARRY